MLLALQNAAAWLRCDDNDAYDHVQVHACVLHLMAQN
jgi:hypothetical protein